MKLVIQRVKKAKVSLEKSGEAVGEIGKGLFVLVGFKEGDTEEIAEQLAKKLIKLRVMSDDQDKMNLSVSDANAGLLIVSQFTLYANTSGGNRPSFIDAEEPKRAEELYNHFVEKLNGLRPGEPKVQEGKFGEYMDIEASLDGPVTIILES